MGNIHTSVLQISSTYMDSEESFLSQQEYLQMPRESIRTLVMSAEKDAVKRFLSHMHQSWDQLQVETTQVCQKDDSHTLSDRAI